MIAPSPYSRARGMLLGVAAGDALGAPVENVSAAEIAIRYPYGLQDIYGMATDDTAQMLALARSLNVAGSYDPELAMANYIQWFITDGFGIGSNSRYVLNAVRFGTTPATATREFYELQPARPPSNGALMRSAPLALRFYHDREALETFSRQDAALTHYHAVCAETCTYFNNLIADVMGGKEPEFREAPFPHSNQAWPEVLAAAYASDERAIHMAGTMRGFILVPLAVAAVAWRRGYSLEETVIWAASLGGDADTNAAIVGALFGAAYGEEAIPKRWREAIGDTNEIEELADALLEHTGTISS